jgi:hypothetical protein
MNNEGKYLWSHEKEKRRKKEKVQHIYMTGKEKSPWQQEKRRRTYVRAEKKEREWWPYDNGDDYETPSLFLNEHLSIKEKVYWFQYVVCSQVLLFHVNDCKMN